MQCLIRAHTIIGTTASPVFFIMLSTALVPQVLVCMRTFRKPAAAIRGKGLQTGGARNLTSSQQGKHAAGHYQSDFIHKSLSTNPWEIYTE
jgi:hypothetical protein